MPSLLPFVELGLASGLRSMAAVSQLSQTLADAEMSGETDGAIADLLSRPWAQALTRTMAAGEMVVDKLSIVPDRTDAGPLVGRAINGAATAHVLATRKGESPALAVMLGAASAIIGAHVGFRVRRALTQRADLPDLPVALCEDIIAIALARHALATLSDQPAGDLEDPAAWMQPERQN